MAITEVLAVYGASLSTATFVWNYFRAKSQVRVVLIPAVETVEGEVQMGTGISIQNVSDKTVHITHVSLLYPFDLPTFRSRVKHLLRYKRISRNQGWCHVSLSNLGIKDNCPASIESGKAHWIFIRQDVVDHVLERAQSRSLKAVVQDALWRNTYSKALT